jgi:uncharacterized protein YabE (DUF348 family)
MATRIVKKEGGKLTIEVDMDLKGSMLTQEEAIQVALNEAGKLATLAALEVTIQGVLDANNINLIRRKHYLKLVD